MNTKILLHAKVILFVLLQCVFMSAVNSEYPICKVGEALRSGAIFTSGLASQCSGLSKITTAECELASEYDSKNNIDKNVGFEGGGSYR